jgi:hypothetical protein
MITAEVDEKGKKKKVALQLLTPEEVQASKIPSTLFLHFFPSLPSSHCLQRIFCLRKLDGSHASPHNPSPTMLMCRFPLAHVS